MDNFHLQDHSQKKWTSTHAIHRNCCFNFDSLVRKIAPLSRGRLNDISTKPLLNLYITIFAIQQDHLNLSLDITYQLNWFTATTTFSQRSFWARSQRVFNPTLFSQYISQLQASNTPSRTQASNSPSKPTKSRIKLWSSPHFPFPFLPKNPPNR